VKGIVLPAWAMASTDAAIAALEKRLRETWCVAFAHRQRRVVGLSQVQRRQAIHRRYGIKRQRRAFCCLALSRRTTWKLQNILPVLMK
jgi:hypothetical protein